MVLKHGFLISSLHLSLLRPFMNAVKNKVHLWSVHTRCRMMRLFFLMAQISGGFSSSGHWAEYITDGSSLAFPHLNRMLNQGRLKGMQLWGVLRSQWEKDHREVHGASKSWRPSCPPRVLLKHHSISLTRGSITLGSEGPGFICFSFFPSPPPFSPFLQQLFIKCLECVRLCAAHRESNVGPDRHSSC